jgi:hypothetical protein
MEEDVIQKQYYDLNRYTVVDKHAVQWTRNQKFDEPEGHELTCIGNILVSRRRT